jgi:hypothetical protein
MYSMFFPINHRQNERYKYIQGRREFQDLSEYVVISF